MTPKVLESVLVSLGITAEDLGCSQREADHIHLLVSYPPKVSISEMVSRFKTRSSRKIREEYPGILEVGKTGLFWSRSYFACSVGGASQEILKKYIENQTTD